MNQLIYKTPSVFSARKVSVDQTIRLLNRNGIHVDREKAEVILDFLYLIAKTYKMRQEHNKEGIIPKE